LTEYQYIIPPWFIKLIGPFIAEPLALLYNASIAQSTVPSQWKVVQITPIPKVPCSTLSIHFRLVSVLSPFSTILEKLLFCHHIYLAISYPSSVIDLSDQFAFRPTGSTTAAVNSIIDKVTTILMTEPYVHVIALDFLHAFDVVRHSTQFDKLASLPLPDYVFNWLFNFYSCRSHCVKFKHSCLQSVISTPVWCRTEPWVLYLSSATRRIFRSPRPVMLWSSMLTICT